MDEVGGQATVIALCVAGLSHGGMLDQSGDLSAETSEMPSGRFLKVSRRRGEKILKSLIIFKYEKNHEIPLGIPNFQFRGNS